MSVEEHPGQILKLLIELTDLVKKLEAKVQQPKVENHTHHHYPTIPTYNYPTQWTYGSGYYQPLGGTTTTRSTHDPNTNPNNDPNPSGT